MTDALSWSLQKAIYQQLAGDDAITALIGDPPRLYDAPPRDVAFPYLVLGETRVRDWPGVEGGLDHDIRLRAWSRHQGRREIKRLLNVVYDALHERPLALEGQRLVHLRFVFADIFPRAENGVFQGVARFRALTQPEPITQGA
ncbi:MAG: DUF3168 domain-containing protein [Pseudomonadota bacterium]